MSPGTKTPTPHTPTAGALDALALLLHACSVLQTLASPTYQKPLASYFNFYLYELQACVAFATLNNTFNKLNAAIDEFREAYASLPPGLRKMLILSRYYAEASAYLELANSSLRYANSTWNLVVKYVPKVICFNETNPYVAVYCKLGQLALKIETLGKQALLEGLSELEEARDFLSYALSVLNGCRILNAR